jgi:uncharacterized protein YgiB involved in biofilm formation
MRYVVLAFIAAVAIAIGTILYRGDCPGGVSVTSEEQCVSRSGLGANICRQIFASAKEIAARSSSVYPDQFRCAQQFGACMPHATVQMAFVPVPAGFCVSTNAGRITAIDPFYQPAAAGPR